MASENTLISKEVHLLQAGLTNLPSNWSVVEIGELFSPERGISVGVMYPGKHDPFGIPLLKVGDFRGSVINPNPDFRITPEKHHEYRRTAFEGGELLLTLVGGLGQCAIVPPEMAGWNAARAIAVIRLKELKNAKFVRLCLLSSPLQHLMQVWANTTVQATLNLKEIKQLPLPWPPAAEREAIAHILSTLDHKIELNQQMNRNLEAIAQAIFKSWFVDFEPVRTKMERRQLAGIDAATAALFPDSFEVSQLEKISQEWKVKPLDQVANFLNGLALQKYPPTGDEYLPVIKIAELRRGITESSGRASPNINKEYVVEDGDILFSWSGSLEVSIWCGGKGALNQHLFKVTSTEFPKWFYYQWVKYYLPNFQAIAASKATTMGHIQRHHLTEAQVLVPPADTLQMMDKRMTPLINRIVSNNLESRTLIAIRDALLPKLMSGEIRVKQAEKLVEAVA